MPASDSVHNREEAILAAITGSLCRQQRPQSLITDNGDDALAFIAAGTSLVTTDMSIEDVHFTRRLWPEDIGYRAMAANLSDIAAMGGRPRYAVISLGLSPAVTVDWVTRLYRGLLEAAEPAHCYLGGGDISQSEKSVIAITVYGETHNSPITRSGACTGHTIYVTGYPGASLAGYELIYEKTRGDYPFLEKAHRRPLARHTIIDSVIAAYEPSAMIDISDGLSTDLIRLCTASKTGCTLYGRDFPVHHQLMAYCEETGSDPENFILASGEEYELLFTSPKKLPAREIEGIPVTPVGIITPGAYLMESRKTGTSIPLKSTGYHHFKETP